MHSLQGAVAGRSGISFDKTALHEAQAIMRDFFNQERVHLITRTLVEVYFPLKADEIDVRGGVALICPKLSDTTMQWFFGDLFVTLASVHKLVFSLYEFMFFVEKPKVQDAPAGRSVLPAEGRRNRCTRTALLCCG